MANERAPASDNLVAAPAPMPLCVIEEFINTRRRDGDEIGTPQQLADVVARPRSHTWRRGGER